MWAVLEKKTAGKQIDRAPKEIIANYEFWKLVVQSQGPLGLRAIQGFKDHALKGEWAGARSSYLNRQWRVIYVAERQTATVIVLEVNAHEYRK